MDKRPARNHQIPFPRIVCPQQLPAHVETTTWFGKCQHPYATRYRSPHRETKPPFRLPRRQMNKRIISPAAIVCRILPRENITIFWDWTVPKLSESSLPGFPVFARTRNESICMKLLDEACGKPFCPEIELESLISQTGVDVCAILSALARKDREFDSDHHPRILAGRDLTKRWSTVRFAGHEKGPGLGPTVPNDPLHAAPWMLQAEMLRFQRSG
jgi:hypothetical protein